MEKVKQPNNFSNKRPEKVNVRAPIIKDKNSLLSPMTADFNSRHPNMFMQPRCFSQSPSKLNNKKKNTRMFIKARQTEGQTYLSDYKENFGILKLNSFNSKNTYQSTKIQNSKNWLAINRVVDLKIEDRDKEPGSITKIIEQFMDDQISEIKPRKKSCILSEKNYRDYGDYSSEIRNPQNQKKKEMFLNDSKF